MALVAEPAIAVVLGVRWLPAAGILSLIALFAVCRSLASTASSLFFAQGRPATVAAISILGLACFLVLGIPLGAERGALGVALAKLIAGGFAAAASLAAVVHYSRVSVKDLGISLFRPCSRFRLHGVCAQCAARFFGARFRDVAVRSNLRWRRDICLLDIDCMVVSWDDLTVPERLFVSAATKMVVRLSSRANSD